MSGRGKLAYDWHYLVDSAAALVASFFSISEAFFNHHIIGSFTARDFFLRLSIVTYAFIYLTPYYPFAPHSDSHPQPMRTYRHTFKILKAAQL